MHPWLDTHCHTLFYRHVPRLTQPPFLRRYGLQRHVGVKRMSLRARPASPRRSSSICRITAMLRIIWDGHALLSLCACRLALCVSFALCHPGTKCGRHGRNAPLTLWRKGVAFLLILSRRRLLALDRLHLKLLLLFLLHRGCVAGADLHGHVERRSAALGQWIGRSPAGEH